MSQRSILSASVQASFPDNTSGFITPAGLRNEQGLFVSYSVLNEQTASIIAQAVATASVGGGVLVTTSSFNAYTASTNTFTSSIQTQVNTLQSVTSSYVNNAQTSSFVNNSQTSSMLAPYVQNSQTGSFATTGSNSFSGSNTFSGSVFIQTASISVLYADKIVSSSTIFSSGSNTLGDASDDTQTLWGTIDIKTGPLQVSGSTDISGSLLINGSSPILSNQTGSFATTGANTFTGSQTIQSQSLLLQASSSVALNTNFFTASTAGTTFGANVLMFAGSANSGSFIISGSRNIGTVNQGTNTLVSTRFAGFNGTGNFGIFANTYSTASVAPILTNNFLASGIQHLMNNTSSITTAIGNFVGGAIQVTGSATSAIQISQNNIDSVTIENNFTSSVGANQSVIVSNSIIKGNTATSQALIKFANTGSNSSARQFISNILFGTNITASLEANLAQGNLLNTSVIGSNLIVSGTQNSNSLSGSVFVGQYNELTATYAPADPSLVKFAVGTGNSTTRRTSFQVFGTGEVVISAAGGGIQSRGWTQFSQSAAQICSATINAGTTVGAFNGSFVTNGGSIAGGNAAITTAIVAGELNTITAGRSSATLGASSNTLNTQAGSDSNNVIVGANASIISGSNSFFTGIYSSTGSIITGSRHSAIIAGGVGTRLNNTTGSVALGRDTAYTGTANYTLFTQNVDISGSLTVNGNRQFNYGEFWMSSSQTPSSGVSQSVVFDSTGHSVGVAISGSGAFIKVTNGGVYNIQFSAQINANAGTDTMWMWFKKNGTNIAASNSKAVLANNTAQLITVNILDTATANDYYEIVYQNNAGNAQILSEAASGNYPSIPGVILTVTQVA
jgi:fibronectin-binding autotransporter adhesin